MFSIVYGPINGRLGDQSPMVETIHWTLPGPVSHGTYVRFQGTLLNANSVADERSCQFFHVLGTRPVDQGPAFALLADNTSTCQDTEVIAERC